MESTQKSKVLMAIVRREQVLAAIIITLTLILVAESMSIFMKIEHLDFAHIFRLSITISFFISSWVADK